MQQKWMTFIMFVLLGNVIYFTACNVERLDEDLTLETILERQEGCRLVVLAKISSTEDLEPIEDVTLTSDLFDEPVMSDEDGKFRLDLDFDPDDNPEVTEVEISAEGFVTKTIEVDFSELLEDCAFLTEVDWSIGLSPKKPAIELSASGPTTVTVSDEYAIAIYEENEAGNLVAIDTQIVSQSYTVVLPAASGSDELSICISPDRSFARGEGIVQDEDSQELPLASFSVDAPEGLVLNGNIQITFTSDLPIATGDVINVSNGSIINFSSSAGTLTILVSTLDDITVVNSFGCVIDATSLTTGQRRSRQTLSNCNCGDAQSFTFFDPFMPTTSLNIIFPEEMSIAQQSAITQQLFNCVNSGFTSDDDELEFEEGVSVVAGKCEVVTLQSTDVVSTTRGEILGIPFTLRVSDASQTSITTGECPTTTACHQGCPE